MAEDHNETPFPENQNPEPRDDDQNDKIPDWMKEAGWETSSGSFDESKPVFDDLDDNEDEIVPADIPAWLEEVAPEGFTSDPNATPAFEGLDVDEPFITTGDLVPPPSMEPPVEELESEPMDEPKKSENGKGFDIPTWLENLELDEDSQETAVAWLENMPENLRATEEELLAAAEIETEEPEVIEEHVDELAWIDDIAIKSDKPSPSADDDQAALSEDLISSDLIPEVGEPDQIFEQEEIESMESDLPSWLKELGEEQPETPVTEEPQTVPPPDEMEMPSVSQEETIPEWLSTTDEEEIPVTPQVPSPELSTSPASDEVSDIPDWLSEFEESAPDSGVDEDSLEWLDSLDKQEPQPETTAPPTSEGIFEGIPSEGSDFTEEELEDQIQDETTAVSEDASTLEAATLEDETLNTQIPDWLSKIDDSDDLEEPEPLITGTIGTLEESEPQSPEDDFETSDSWLDQISETSPGVVKEEVASQVEEAIEWLDDIKDTTIETPADTFEDLEESSTEITEEETPPVELETAKYLTEEEEGEISDDLPDWLAELREDEDDQSISLEDAIKQADHELNQAEVDFLSKAEEKHADEVDWLSKLDEYDREAELEPTTPAAEIEELFEAEPVEEEPIEELPEEPIAAGGILDRLKDTSEFKSQEEVPQWLADIKNEEDPQETAVLWLQQFVNQGDAADIKDEIKRYTDELDPGDSIPKWMEDLKNEEDPQTTAMLWLEKLAADRQKQTRPETAEEDSGWLADLEREVAEGAPTETAEEIKDFDDSDAGWLADLEIDDKLKTPEEEIPDWSKTEEESPEGEPSWMKATSPLEGEFVTDELGDGKEQEVEIPEWLAGYAEGERPEDLEEQETEDEDEYTWLSATGSAPESPPTTRSPLDLNKAAISQLESILGISHQIAKGIVSYREKHGLYQDFSDLKNVPEITDEQTIEILKPEVFISTPSAAEEHPTPTPSPKEQPTPPKRKPAKSENYEEILVTARTRINEREINEAVELYSSLIKKKKFLDETIEDLQKASLDHPLEISIQKTLGDAFMKKDMLDQALEAYSKAEDLLT